MGRDPQMPSCIQHIDSQVPVSDVLFVWEFQKLLSVVISEEPGEVHLVRCMVDADVLGQICNPIASFLGDPYQPSRNAISGVGGEVSFRMAIAEHKVRGAFAAHCADSRAFTGPSPLRWDAFRQATYLWQGFLRVPGPSLACLHDLIGVW